ncbi:MAG: DUF2061 domain-containing protein [Halobacteriales archaeon]
MLSWGAGDLVPVLRRRRILLKTLGYRVLSVVLTVAVAYLVVRDAGAAIDIGVVANAAKMGLYYFHERAWHRLESGNRRP